MLFLSDIMRLIKVVVFSIGSKSISNPSRLKVKTAVFKTVNQGSIPCWDNFYFHPTNT